MGGNTTPVNVNDAKRKTFFRNLALAIIVFLVFFTLPNLCGAHGSHQHDHHGHSHDEPASFKYSRQANEEILKKEEHHHHGHHHHHHDDDGHGHAHGHGNDHGHGHRAEAKTTSKQIPLG